MKDYLYVSHVKNYLHSLCIRIAHFRIRKCDHLFGIEFIFLILEISMHLVNVINYECYKLETHFCCFGIS